MQTNLIIEHNVLQTPWPIPDQSVDVCVTSPPYWGLRDYNHPDQIGQEETPEEFVAHLVEVFREVHRVLKPQGTVWLNLADTYWGGKGQSGAGWSRENGGNLNSEAVNWAEKGMTRPQDRHHPHIKPKDLVGIPWSVAFALREAGWYLRQDIIWHKPNPMPESIMDRCTKSHEYIFLLSKERRYYFDYEAIMQPATKSTNLRMDQDVDGQKGSDRVLGKTNGNMKSRIRTSGNGPCEVNVANKKSVWTVTAKGFDGEFCTACRRYYSGKEKGLIRVEKVTADNRKVKTSTCLCGRTDAWISHFAVFPEDLIIDCIKASTRLGGVVLDPFMGAGTTALVALAQGRQFLGLELNPAYADLARHRLKKEFGLFFNL